MASNLLNFIFIWPIGLIICIPVLYGSSEKIHDELAIPWKFSRVKRHQEVLSNNLDNNISSSRSSLLSECPELKHFCNDLQQSDDLSILECIQSYHSSQVGKLSEKCQHALWRRTKDLLDDSNLKFLLERDCNNNVIRSCIRESSPGNLFTCVINKRESTNGQCNHLINQIEWVAFSDFRLIKPFIEACQDDIEHYQCGRLEPQKETLSQGKTLTCLQTNIDQLTDKCRMEVLHLSEIQSDNLKLDRQLYLACAKEHATFCSNYRFGETLAFKCLTMHKADSAMSQNCREQLTRRQKLIAHDYRVSRGLSRACKEDIKLSHCRKGVSDDKDIRLAQILLCLEAVIRNGTKINAECQLEIIDHRKMLLEDYRLSPEIVSGCAEDITEYCNGMEVGGKTIHCLLEHARPKRKKKVSIRCLRALEDLVKKTDAGEDWRVDPVLYEACKSVVDVSCKDIRGGNARVMTCLVDKIGTSYMNEACENALVQIQYFVARDFKLDPQLYSNCRKDAIRLCHAKRSWDDFGEVQAPENAPLVLPCLYRYAYHANQSMQLSHNCLAEIHRVMRQRAISVDLQPEIEEVCLDDLSKFCYDKTARGEEMQCLQENLDNLENECRKAVSTFTEQQAEHVDLNPIIRTTCMKIMNKLCLAELQQKDEGDLMECLIIHKNHPEMRQDIKCRASVEHFQLISLKNYHFTYKFKEACNPYVINFCPKARSGADVIECLSERVRNDTLNNVRNSITKDCRQQIRAQLFQQREHIDLDPKLKMACLNEVYLYCGKVERGAGRVLECLQSVNPEKLSKQCQKVIFRIKKLEMVDNSVDYTLLTVCEDMLKMFCFNKEKSKALECLKSNRDDHNFDPKCKRVVLNRMIDQHRDFRLNPGLQADCMLDIKAHCQDILVKELQNSQGELNGSIINCLKEKFRLNKLSSNCQKQMINILHEQALNYNLNPVLRTICAVELEAICKPPDEGLDEHTGEVEECLKNAFVNNKLINNGCKVEVALLIEEAKPDIHVDPLLQQACMGDLMRYCSHIQQGNGRHLKCLEDVMNISNNRLTKECSDMLQKRIKMFEHVKEVELPKNVQELYEHINASPSRKYFAVVALTFIGVIFIIGLFCGKITNRAIAMKNK